MELSPKLKARLKELPKEPGVYFHKNREGEVIYVGKAAILRNRVRQYFQSPERKDPKTRALVAEIDYTDWIVVDTEMDALFLESEMIKRYMPKWNILLRDDKTVILRKIFPYYDKPYTGKKTLNTDLGLTPGIEVGKCTPADYKRNLRQLISYLKGNRKALIKDLEKKMYAAADAGEYEKAAEYRNQYFGLKGIGTKIVFSDKEFLDISNDRALEDLQDLLELKKPPVRIEGYDISHQSGTNVVGSMVCFINGTADRTRYRRFKLRRQQNNDPASMREVITRRLKHLNDWGKPDLIVLDGSVGQLDAVRDVIAEAGIPVIGRDKSGDHSRNARVRLVIPENTEDYRMVELASDSHIAKLIARIDEESHRFAIQYHVLLKRKNSLK